jgi:hypothetical protein
MRRRAISTAAILLLSSLILISLTGCEKQLVLHPISQQDIVRVKTGISAVPPKDGYFLSDDFFKEVLKAKVQ